MKKLYVVFLFALFHAAFFPLQAQSDDTVRLQQIRTKLDSLVARDPAYLSEVDISAGQIPLAELLRNVAKVNGVSLSVKDDGKMKVSCNFARARIDDLLFFLCKEYRLGLDVVGNIVSVFPYKIPDAPPPPPVVGFNPADSTLSYDLVGAPLPDIARNISSLCGINFVVPQELYTKQVTGYVESMPLAEALYTLAELNGLAMVKSRGAGTWTVSAPAVGTDGLSEVSTPYVRRREFAPGQLDIDSAGRITAMIDQGNIYDIVLDVCGQLDLNYFFITPISAPTSIYLKNTDVRTLFNVLFTGTPYSYYEEGGVYMFGGSAGDKGLVSARIVPMKYRAADKVVEIIPETLKAGLQVQMFGDLNSIIVSGDQRQVARVEQFLESVDKTVPLITIDILIVDASKTRIDEAGMKVGLGEQPVRTAGTLSPGVDMTLGASSINSLINSFNGFGVVKLGKVSPNLYMNLKLMESNGDIQLQSTPKLSTLNGHEATLTSGETKYYKEINNTYMGTQNPVQSTSYTWKNVEANLTVRITPFVSTDRHITLDIDITQTEFTTREEKEAPPGTSTRSFKSLIRVQDEEVVLLGGIERNSREKSTEGLPGIARIPVLKWLFGTTKDNKTEHKLNVFIKPSIID